MPHLALMATVFSHDQKSPIPGIPVSSNHGVAQLWPQWPSDYEETSHRQSLAGATLKCSQLGLPFSKLTVCELEHRDL